MSTERVESTEKQVEPKLKFERIDVSFIYGYVNYNLRKSKPPPKESNFSKMWAPIYNLNRSSENDGFCIEDLIKDEPITIIPTNNHKEITAKLSAYILRKRYDTKLQESRKTDGGPGSLTIKISVEPQEAKFNTNTIFDILNLAPRTSAIRRETTEISDETKISEIKGLEHFDKSDISTKISNFSPLFKLFCNLLYENQHCWSELYEPHEICGSTNSSTNKCEQCKIFYPFYDIDCSKPTDKFKTDPQIPYMLVEGFLPKEFYKTVFIDTPNEFQKNYTHEIGCLVGRWLNIDNRGDLNIDYYRCYKDIDAIIEKDRDIFISRFRDKKTFVVLSSLMTLILKCKNFDKDTEEKDSIAAKAADKAVRLTTNAVLSYLEFSRTRLHNALWLNKQLDKVVNNVDEQETTKEILESKNRLNTLKVKVAKSMNNPISYMWDSVLGQEIPSLKINRNVEKLENDTLQKLNLINELIADKIQNSQISDFEKRYNSK